MKTIMQLWIYWKEYVLKATSLLVIFMISCVCFSQKLHFSTGRGFYEQPFQLSLSTDIPNGVIYYTTNGSVPSAMEGTLYSGPITIAKTSVVRAIAFSQGMDTSKVHTHTYIFLSDVIRQPQVIPGWPLKTYGIGQGNAVMDYEMDPKVVNDPAYSTSIIPGLKAIPSMSVVMNQQNFWQFYDDQDGIAEEAASIELIYEDTSMNEQVDCGIQAHSWNRMKRSMRLNFKKKYDDGKFHSNIFKNAPVGGETATTYFDHIILRAGNNRSWARTWNPDKTCYTRDEWYRESQVAMDDGVGPHGTFVHLYINGVYWGLYNPVERPDSKFTSTYLGGTADDWLAVSEGGVFGGGDSSRWLYIRDVLTAKDMSVTANYEELKQYLDVAEFCDYLIVSWMTGKTDWPENNWWGGNNNNPPAPFKYFTWDCEWSWDTTKRANNGAWVHPQFRNTSPAITTLSKLWHAAKNNKTFMTLFADRVYLHCFNNGALTDENSRARWRKLNDYIRDAIIAESARWGDALGDSVTRTRDAFWTPEVQRVDGLMNGNVQRFINALRKEGYYPDIIPPVFSSAGGIVPEGFKFDLSNPNASGSIYYTLDGTDPLGADGALSTSAKLYKGTLSVTSPVKVVARVRNGAVWSPKNNQRFVLAISHLSINEIMTQNTTTYQDEHGEYDDWIEIFNNQSSSLDIGGLYITDDMTNPGKWQIPSTQPEVTTIPAHGFLVLWADKQPAQGVTHTDFKLNSASGQIGLFQIEGDEIILIDSLSYGKQKSDTTYGRYKDGTGTLRYFTVPTPGKPNDTTGVHVTGIASSHYKVDAYWLNMFPNPFTYSVTIEFGCHKSEFVTIDVYSLRGEFVDRLFEGKVLGGVIQTLEFNGSDLEAGTYLVQIRSSSFISNRILLKK